MVSQEYLLSYGSLGDFGRFFPIIPITCRRDDRAVIRSHRGLEIGTVLSLARPGHAVFLPNTSVGELLRLATSEDERRAQHMQTQAQQIFDQARRYIHEWQLSMEVLDVEVLLDGEHAILHQVRWVDDDVRSLVSTLSREFAVYITLQDIARQEAAVLDDDDSSTHGCGRPDCGSVAGNNGNHGGGCGSEAGCSSCGLKKALDTKAYFAGLRQQMEQRPFLP